MAQTKKYTINDGKMLLTLELMPEGGFLVRSPMDPALITTAETIPQAFSMARDAMKALQASRAKRGAAARPRRRATA